MEARLGHAPLTWIYIDQREAVHYYSSLNCMTFSAQFQNTVNNTSIITCMCLTWFVKTDHDRPFLSVLFYHNHNHETKLIQDVWPTHLLQYENWIELRSTFASISWYMERILIAPKHLLMREKTIYSQLKQFKLYLCISSLNREIKCVSF